MTSSEKKLPTDFGRCDGYVFPAKYSSKHPAFENRKLVPRYAVYEEGVTPPKQSPDAIFWFLTGVLP